MLDLKESNCALSHKRQLWASLPVFPSL